MIQKHQPTIFDESLIARVSSKQNGSMLSRSVGVHNPDIVASRKKWLEQCSIDYQQVVYQQIIYNDSGTYDQIASVDIRASQEHTPGIVADALITNQPGVALFLPVADCVATIIHDPKNHAVAMLHLGRHSARTDLVAKVIKSMKLWYESDPSALKAYLSPSVKKGEYVLEYFDDADTERWRPFVEHKNDGIHIDVPGRNQQALIDAGLLTSNIEVSPIDTAIDENYYSHYKGDTDQRFAAVAMLC